MDLKIDEGLKSLLESGKDKGYLTYSQVNDYLPDDAVNPEKLDQLLLILEEQGIELIELLGVDGVVRQVVVDLGEGQVAFFLALVEQGLQALVELLHQTLRWELSALSSQPDRRLSG